MRPITVRRENGQCQFVDMPAGVTHVVAVDPADAAPLASLALHRHDLQRARDFLDEINKAPSGHAQAGLWEAALGSYYKTYKTMARRQKLDATTVYASDPDGLEIHRLYEAIRDKHVLHDENGLTGISIGAAVAIHDPEGPITEIVFLNYDAVVLNQPAFNNLRLLITRTIEWVETEFDRLATALRQKLNARGRTAVEAMPAMPIRFEFAKVQETRTA